MQQPADNITCPYTGHKHKCKKHFMNCPKWIKVRGVIPNTGEEVDEYRCEDSWLPYLMVETSKEQRQTAAAIESFRNIINDGIQSFLGLAHNSTRQIKPEEKG